jgi:hypothetical protein
MVTWEGGKHRYEVRAGTSHVYPVWPSPRVGGWEFGKLGGSPAAPQRMIGEAT